MRTSTVALTTAWAALASAQILTPSQLASIPPPVIQVVPSGGGNQTIPYNQQAAYNNAYSSFSGSSSRFRRRTDGDCSAQPLGSGPVPSTDTDTAFLADPDFATAANGAATPAGWNLIFQNQQSAVSTSAYMGYKSYSSYSPAQCAADCAAATGCQSFNIFFERDPTQNPGANCPNPPSTTVIKCSFWGTVIPSTTLTNNGQYRSNFHVVIAGSNGYQVAPATISVPGFNGTYTGNATINSPNQCGSYITFKSHTGPYDPNLCAADCVAERSNTAPFNGQTCRFFASYQLVKNGVVQAQICALYTQTWGTSYAVNTGYSSGSDVYTIVNAYSYTYSSDIGSFVCGSNGVTSTTSSTTTSTTTSTSTPCPTPTGPTYLSRCPRGLGDSVANDGQLYRYCSDTDLQIPSANVWSNVPTMDACSTLCENTSGCLTVVYNTQTQICYNKGNVNPNTNPSGLNWVNSLYFLTNTRVADGTPLTRCPSGNIWTTASDGHQYLVCPKTDYNYGGPDIWSGVQSQQACINLCEASSRCSRASYNPSTQYCYSKGTVQPALTNLVSQSKFMTFQKQ